MNTKIKFAAKIQRKNFNNDKSSFSWVHVPSPLLTYVLCTFLLTSLNKCLAHSTWCPASRTVKM